VTDGAGQPVTPGLAFRRGASVRRAWWNRQQLLRQVGVMGFLSGGEDFVPLAADSGSTFALARTPLVYESSVRINERALALAGDEELALDDGLEEAVVGETPPRSEGE